MPLYVFRKTPARRSQALSAIISAAHHLTVSDAHWLSARVPDNRLPIEGGGLGTVGLARSVAASLDPGTFASRLPASGSDSGSRRRERAPAPELQSGRLR
jgi:hypothetical protein